MGQARWASRSSCRSSYLIVRPRISDRDGQAVRHRRGDTCGRPMSWSRRKLSNYLQRHSNGLFLAKSRRCRCTSVVPALPRRAPTYCESQDRSSPASSNARSCEASASDDRSGSRIPTRWHLPLRRRPCEGKTFRCQHARQVTRHSSASRTRRSFLVYDKLRRAPGSNTTAPTPTLKGRRWIWCGGIRVAAPGEDTSDQGARGHEGARRTRPRRSLRF